MRQLQRKHVTTAALASLSAAVVLILKYTILGNILGIIGIFLIPIPIAAAGIKFSMKEALQAALIATIVVALTAGIQSAFWLAFIVYPMAFALIASTRYKMNPYLASFLAAIIMAAGFFLLTFLFMGKEGFSKLEKTLHKQGELMLDIIKNRFKPQTTQEVEMYRSYIQSMKNAQKFFLSKSGIVSLQIAGATTLFFLFYWIFSKLKKQLERFLEIKIALLPLSEVKIPSFLPILLFSSVLGFKAFPEIAKFLFLTSFAMLFIGGITKIKLFIEKDKTVFLILTLLGIMTGQLLVLPIYYAIWAIFYEFTEFKLQERGDNE